MNSNSRRGIVIVALLSLFSGGLLATGQDAEKPRQDKRVWTESFPMDSYDFSTTGSNRYWILVPGHQIILAKMGKTKSEIVVITVLDETEKVNGIETRVVEEREFKRGKLKEVSRNFFAICKKTSAVFYFGEDVDDYKRGKVVAHGGQWRAGKNGARAGLMMPGVPLVGARHYQEFAPKEAMDRAEILSTTATYKTRVGTLKNCLKVVETSPLEPGSSSKKRYAPGIGMIYDDGLEIVAHGQQKSIPKMVEFEIKPSEMTEKAAAKIKELHPKGKIKEVKIEIHRMKTRYAVEIMVGPDQWDVELTEKGKVLLNVKE